MKAATVRLQLKCLYILMALYESWSLVSTKTKSSPRIHHVKFLLSAASTMTTDVLPLTQQYNYQHQRGTITQSKSSKALPRALRLFDIIWKDIITPVYTTLIQRGIPASKDKWNDFWLHPVMGSDEKPLTLAGQSALALEKLGATYVKFGQALAARPDVVPRSLALALSTLQDSMQPFDTPMAKQIIENELLSADINTGSRDSIQSLIESLSEMPVAAASIGQVYSGMWKGKKVAIKVQRPGIKEMVQEDSDLLRMIVETIEAIPAIPGIQEGQERFVQTDLSGAVNEFMSRLLEELDYNNEAKNIQLFYDLYSHQRDSKDTDDINIEVVVPKVYMDLCTDRVLVMEWIEGTKLVDLESENSTRESLALIEQGIECTLSQLLDTGVMHADPHAGNLLKVLDTSVEGEQMKQLGYIDFGLLSSVPVTVRDGLVCAVAELVFARNVSAVASLFGELQLIPEEILAQSSERLALTEELNEALSSVLKYNSAATDIATTKIPTLRFDKLLDALTRLVPRFQFQLPPYFLNNARALGTLEGMAREIDPSFNVLQVLYPYALGRLLSNPTDSPIVEATLQSLIRSPSTGHVDSIRVQKLLDDSTLLTGFSKRKVIRDILKAKNGPRLARTILKEKVKQSIRGRLSKMSNYLRL